MSGYGREKAKIGATRARDRYARTDRYTLAPLFACMSGYRREKAKIGATRARDRYAQADRYTWLQFLHTGYREDITKVLELKKK